jgi:hypothetical protein
MIALRVRRKYWRAKVEIRRWLVSKLVLFKNSELGSIKGRLL